MKAGRSPRLNFPEQKYAYHTLWLLAMRLLRGKIRRNDALFLIIGPSGCGKTRLLRGLHKKILSSTTPNSAKTVQMGGARELVSLWREQEIKNRAAANSLRKQIIDLDLLILEDAQHLKKEESAYLIPLIDERAAHRKATVFSSTQFTQKLNLEPAFINRLNSSLRLELTPLSQESKLLYLSNRLAALGMELPPRMTEWLSQKADGSLRKMQSLCHKIAHEFKPAHSLPTLEDLARIIQAHRPASKMISMENITLKVGKMFRVTPKSIVTKKRDKETLLPRQVSMYIARKMTGMSLLEIGAFFGGRNHTTVSHALKKVELALKKDHALSGTIRQLENDLS